MFEAEIKYLADGPLIPPGEFLGETVCHDLYFDSPDGAYYASGRELRLRREGGRAVVTAKAPAFDAASRSKEEWETGVADPEAMAAILEGLGFVRRLAFAKRCRRFRTTRQGLALAVTVVTVDFSPLPFVEIEHLAADREAGLAALAVIRDQARALGLSRECPTCYTDLFLAARAGNGPGATVKGATP